MPSNGPQYGSGEHDEQSPLLRNGHSGGGESGDDSGEPTKISFEEDDEENPRNWPYRRKMANVLIIALMAILSPLASSAFTPAIKDIAADFGEDPTAVVGSLTGFAVALGIGPLILAPLSESFGRRVMYLTCFAAFAALQVPAALSPSLPFLIVFRVLAGFFGSVSIANGGGTLSDMFEPSQRAGVFGWYLLGPLLGPTLGPLFGGIIAQYLKWQWIFWVMTIVASLNTVVAYFFLRETYAPTILERRARERERRDGGRFTFEGRDARPLWTKLGQNVQRPLKILFLQPIVFTMALWQALIFATMYSLFTSMEPIFGEDSPYGLNTLQVGCLYLGTGTGFLTAVWLVVPRIDTIFNSLSERHGGKQRPEYRLPLANIGAVLVPASLFWFGWTVRRTHWIVPIIATACFGFGQVSIFNTTQNYYIDAFDKYAASAIAAGTVFRSIIGGAAPLFAPALFDAVGYGWGWTVFGLLTLVLSPSPLLFYRYGATLREKFQVEL